MAYKRNPMRCERINSLSRHVMVLSNDAKITTATQWLERTLDDSANKRICVPESFLATDAILILYENISSNIVVYKNVIKTNMMQELPFMGTEEILMNAVLKGGDRQELHEKIRVYSMEAGREVKEFGRPNDLVDRIAADETFGLTKEEILHILNPDHLCGRAKNQVTDFLEAEVKPVLKKYAELIKEIARLEEILRNPSIRDNIIKSELTEIARKLNIKHQSIIACLKGKNRTAGGFKWKYKKPIDSKN